jgi:alkanesulfonate monooxygenase SsuD/methylene tetrahydromethanopterin reductase-like flavin-dependent oxidoreductase (luciferase family)
MEIGYWLASEEQPPKALVENARLAEDAGFGHVLISDHIHPWPRRSWTAVSSSASARART